MTTFTTADRIAAEQRTSDWFAERVGFITGSRLNDVLAKKDSAARKNYVLQLAIERINNKPAEPIFVNDAMQRGIDKEDDAVLCFEANTGIFTEKCGFIKSKNIEWFGASPDRLIGSDAILECKVPNTLTHTDYIINGKLPTKYKAQVYGQMLVTERPRGYFMSWDDRLIDGMELFVVEVGQDNEYTDNLINEINLFNKDVFELVEKLLEKKEAMGVK
jgi:putative phage-type endonuclease